jgi:poly-beta-1,6-N-acetyl-D-glucosamine synthase
VITIFIITAAVIAIYLAYPLWLRFFVSSPSTDDGCQNEIKRISIILLSYNGKQYLEGKINFLLDELSAFNDHELIIVDDHSGDGSDAVLRGFEGKQNVRVIFNEMHHGIPYSMNLGVSLARGEVVVFCDQRQDLSAGILASIVIPLEDKQTGAVSGYISSFDKLKKCSLIRRHENYLKSMESRTGSLVGVYGPFYAVKKECYSPIPGYIILDDLYLSLKILASKRIVIREGCCIYDDNFSLLYDYKRARRYLSGLLQILKEKSLIGNLSPRLRVMLLWHKYLRLVIPAMLFLCYLSLGLSLTRGTGYLVAFAAVTLLVMMSLVPGKVMPRFRLKNLSRMNILYFMAFIEIFFIDIFTKRKTRHA